MADVTQLMKSTVDELEKLLNAKNVLGDPIERDGSTVIPIVSYGFGFGTGGGNNPKTGDGEGTGGGGGIKPLGAIIFDKEGARVEAVKGAFSNMADVIKETATAVIENSAKARSAQKPKSASKS